MSMPQTKAIQLPPPAENQALAKVFALNGGFLTLPERLFVTDADPTKAVTVPSLCFLVEHKTADTRTERIVFDLGIKRNLTQYADGMRHHIPARQPIITHPDTRASLTDAGLDPEKDIDYVILSHSHWDHVGTPSDYPNSQFIVGSGTLHMYKHGAPYYPSEMFEKEPLPLERTRELPPTSESYSQNTFSARQTEHKWQPLANFPNAIDFFCDGSVYIIDTPGHLPGHLNLLLRVEKDKWIYLGGDCCHDTRILTGERDIALYDDGHGGKRSVHSDLESAKTTLARIKAFLDTFGDSVEWIVAHDLNWATQNQHRFLAPKQ
ncbi:beta-lactamase-like protein [Talaromyces proteolyticus]|uniref:Beta-lactamase-like protein n=1 Tax=Talaromyces proteolyticus TaxID=1131652 RepID=A0AAD4KDE7_9EURO|nr:beta-lactamase-like protein [Talaromyces proteolyticus]KAH8689062.1 beta-lactamase-like protein [Talaromyces proteolyticus]